MSQRHNKRARRWMEKPFAYRRALMRRVMKTKKHERGYLYVDYTGTHPYWMIWAHELENPVLIHKGGKP